MASRLKSSKVREGAKALQPLALVALVGIVGTVTMLGGCGGGNNFNNNSTPSPFVPNPVSPSPGATVVPTPSGGVTPTPSGGVTPTPSGGVTPTPTPTASAGSPTPTPTATPTPNTLTLMQALDKIKADAGATVTALALAPDNRWAVAFSTTATDITPAGNSYYLPPDAPPTLKNALDGIIAGSGRINSITLGAGDVWLVTYNQSSDSFTEYKQNGIDAGMLAQLINLRLNQNVNVTSAVIGSDPSFWALVVNQNGYYNSPNLPDALKTQLNTLASNNSATINYIALGADNTYAVVYNRNQVAGNATDLMSAINSAGATTINGIGLGTAGSYAVVYNSNQYKASGLTRSR